MIKAESIFNTTLNMLKLALFSLCYNVYFLGLSERGVLLFFSFLDAA